MSSVVTTTKPQDYGSKTKTVWIVASALAVLTVVEYSIALNVANPLLFLVPFVVAKGLLIMDSFMHVRKVLSRGTHS